MSLFGHWERLSVITGADYAEPTRADLPEMPAGELAARTSGSKHGSLSGAGRAAIWGETPHPEAVMAIAPADHLISPDAKFQWCMEEAFRRVEAAPETVCLLGIVPTRPATGYGYIEVESTSLANEGARAAASPRFREKPDITTATEFAVSGRHYWNAGIFVWKAQRFLSLLEQHAPQIAEVVQPHGWP